MLLIILLLIPLASAQDLCASSPCSNGGVCFETFPNRTTYSSTSAVINVPAVYLTGPGLLLNISVNVYPWSNPQNINFQLAKNGTGLRYLRQTQICAGSCSWVQGYVVIWSGYNVSGSCYGCGGGNGRTLELVDTSSAVPAGPNMSATFEGSLATGSWALAASFGGSGVGTMLSWSLTFANSSFAFCSCSAGYTGVSCETELCPPDLCLNNGTCSSGSCSCAAGFTGSRCETVLCPPNFCFNNGTCANGTCLCPPDITGSRCETLLCDPNPCLHGGTCSDGVCHCTFAWNGVNCSIPDQGRFAILVDEIPEIMPLLMPGDVVLVFPRLKNPPFPWPPTNTSGWPITCNITAADILPTPIFSNTVDALTIDARDVEFVGACLEVPTPLWIVQPGYWVDGGWRGGSFDALVANRTTQSNLTLAYINYRQCTALQITAINVTIANFAIDNLDCILLSPHGVFDTGGPNYPLVPAPSLIIAGWPDVVPIKDIVVFNVTFLSATNSIVITRLPVEFPCASVKECIGKAYFVDCAAGPVLIESLALDLITFQSAWTSTSVPSSLAQQDIGIMAANFSVDANVTFKALTSSITNGPVCRVMPSRPYVTATRALKDTTCLLMASGDTSQACGSGDSVVKNNVPQNCEQFRKKQIEEQHNLRRNTAAYDGVCLLLAAMLAVCSFTIAKDTMLRGNKAFARFMPWVKRHLPHIHAFLFLKHGHIVKTAPPSQHTIKVGRLTKALAHFHRLAASSPRM